MYGLEFGEWEGQDLLLFLAAKGLCGQQSFLRIEANEREFGLLLAIDLQVVLGYYALTLDREFLALSDFHYFYHLNIKFEYQTKTSLPHLLQRAPLKFINNFDEDQQERKGGCQEVHGGDEGQQDQQVLHFCLDEEQAEQRGGLSGQAPYQQA